MKTIKFRVKKYTVRFMPQNAKKEKPDFGLIWLKGVRTRRVELPRPNGHYPLKVACLPIPPRAHFRFKKRVQIYNVFPPEQNNYLN